MGYEWSKDLIHVPFGMVALEEGTMSTRKGRVVFLEDVLKQAVEKTKEIVYEILAEEMDATVRTRKEKLLRYILNNKAFRSGSSAAASPEVRFPRCMSR